MFTRFNTIHERDRHQDGQTPHDGIGRAYAGIARQKKLLFRLALDGAINKPLC